MLWNWASPTVGVLNVCVCVYVPKGAAMLLYFNMLGNIYINVHGSLAMQM